MAKQSGLFRNLSLPLRIASLAVLACFCFLAGCEKKAETKSSGPPEVLVTPVIQKDVPITREWLGTTDGSSNADIRARVSGYLQEQFYVNGKLVKQGEPLFLIDPRPFQAALLQAKANLGQAEAKRGQSEAEEQRQKQLFEKKVASVRDYETSVQANLAAKAGVEAGQAAVQQAELNLEYTKITAPIQGIAGVASAEIGDLVGPSAAKPLTTVSCVDPIKVIFPISEQEYLGAAENINTASSTPEAQRPANVELILGNNAVYPHKGRYSVINRQVDSKTGTITIEALFPNPNNILRPGQYAKVRVVTKVAKDALLVPQRAVSELQGNYQVVVVGPDNKASIRPVKVGDRFGSLWVITEGIKPGETVVAEGIQKVKEGAAVAPKPWQPPTPAGAGSNPPAASTEASKPK
jgi:membrane fusion protein (multidrug efflux system)